MKHNCTASQLMQNIDDFFLNNKMSRSLQRQEIFPTTKKGDLNITDFCHSLKNLADSLNDVVCLKRNWSCKYYGNCHHLILALSTLLPIQNRFQIFLKPKTCCLSMNLAKPKLKPLRYFSLFLCFSTRQWKRNTKQNRKKNSGRGAPKGATLMISMQGSQVLQVLNMVLNIINKIQTMDININKMVRIVTKVPKHISLVTPTLTGHHLPLGTSRCHMEVGCQQQATALL